VNLATSLLAGLAVFALNLWGVLRPYDAARRLEQIDAIGSTTRARNVEPTGWNVTVVRISAAVMVVCSGAFVAALLWTA